MTIDQQDASNDQQITNGTPSTASRIKPAALESVFPTPARRARSRSTDSQNNDQPSPLPSQKLGFANNASSTPQKHKSIEALRSHASRALMNRRSSSADPDRSWQRREASKKTSQYFEEAFAVRPPYNTARDRVARDSMIVAELCLNCLVDLVKSALQPMANVGQIEDEEKQRNFLADFLMTLGEVYQRPTNNIMITTVTNAHIMLAGSTEAAYLLTITALPFEIVPIKNQRTITIVQEHLSEALLIPSSRGVIKFHAIREEDFATNSMTVQQEIEKFEQKTVEEKRGLGLRSRQSNRASRKSTLLRSEAPAEGLEPSRSSTPILSISTRLYEHEEDAKVTLVNSVGKAIKGRKSIMSFWKRNGT